ncbi:MAG: PASTA domain-containing protein [Pseudonocardia sp.]
MGAPVTLVLSSGAEPDRIELPFLIGEDAEDAAEELEELDLEAEIAKQLPFGLGDGTVIGMIPGPGSLVALGSTVVLTTL